MTKILCNKCIHLIYGEYWKHAPISCAKGHKPRIYSNPDPDIGIEIKRKCKDYEESK